jgi:hypothetical protein
MLWADEGEGVSPDDPSARALLLEQWLHTILVECMVPLPIP